jgi:FkbM family methyltransferase
MAMLGRRAGENGSGPRRRRSRLRRALQRSRRRLFFHRARHVTPYLAAQLGSEVFFVRTADRGLERGLFVRRSRSDVQTLETALAWLARHGISMPPDPVIIEAGANIGTTTIAAIRRFGFASAVALEPSPVTFRAFRINLIANDLEECVRALQLAAGATSGVRPLDTSRRHSGGHRLARPRQAQKGQASCVDVGVVSLDSLVDDGVIDPATVGLLWIDVAGDEDKVLRGAGLLLSAGVPVVAAIRPCRMKPAARAALAVSLETYAYTTAVVLRPRPVEHRIDELGALLASDRRTLDVLLAAPPQP